MILHAIIAETLDQELEFIAFNSVMGLDSRGDYSYSINNCS